MQPTQKPDIIKKSRAVLALIYLAGLGAAVLLALLAVYTAQPQPLLATFLAIGTFIAPLLAWLYASVYQESSIVLESDKITVNNWINLSSDSSTITLWNRIVDINVMERGILAQIFNYGTIRIESASGDGALLLPYVPDPTKWRDLMLSRVEAAPELTHNV